VAPIIEAHNLVKRYRKVRALDGLDLVADEGRVVALLGPNGAGKTTFVRMLATLTRPDSGTLRVGGIDAIAEPERVRRLIGLAGQYAAVEPTMTGRENLEMVARLFGLSRRDAQAATKRVLHDFDLEEAADRAVKTYSGGMRRRVDLGASMVGAPRLLLLDEPTTGLDPRSRNELWEAIRALVDRGTDVLLTTQYLDEADHLATDIVIVDHGRVVASGTPAELKAKVGGDVVELHVRDDRELAGAGRALTLLGTEPPQLDAATRRVSVRVERGSENLRDALRALDATGIEVDDITLRRPTLDEVFLTLSGKESA
jgi:ABC-2 type transport system ATP-binding protein